MTFDSLFRILVRLLGASARVAAFAGLISSTLPSARMECPT